jgi:hypothetical protein
VDLPGEQDDIDEGVLHRSLGESKICGSSDGSIALDEIAALGHQGSGGEGQSWQAGAVTFSVICGVDGLGRSVQSHNITGSQAGA